MIGPALAACTLNPPPARVPPSLWGGPHVSLEVSDGGARVEFDCAHGTVDEPFLLDSDGRFDLRGAYVREHGGPIREGEPEERRAASYSGRFRGTRLDFSIRLIDDGTVIGPFTAVRDRPPELLKCL